MPFSSHQFTARSIERAVNLGADPFFLGAVTAENTTGPSCLHLRLNNRAQSEFLSGFAAVRHDPGDIHKGEADKILAILNKVDATRHEWHPDYK